MWRKASDARVPPPRAWQESMRHGEKLIITCQSLHQSSASTSPFPNSFLCISPSLLLAGNLNVAILRSFSPLFPLLIFSLFLFFFLRSALKQSSALVNSLSDNSFNPLDHPPTPKPLTQHQNPVHRHHYHPPYPPWEVQTACPPQSPWRFCSLGIRFPFVAGDKKVWRALLRDHASCWYQCSCSQSFKRLWSGSLSQTALMSVPGTRSMTWQQATLPSDLSGHISRVCFLPKGVCVSLDKVLPEDFSSLQFFCFLDKQV